MLIENLKTNISKSIENFNRDELDTAISKELFDFGHEIINEFGDCGIGFDKPFDRFVKYEYDFNISFDKIIFKTIVYSYLNTLNLTTQNLPEITKEGLERAQSQFGSLGGSILDTMIERLSTVPNSFRKSTSKDLKRLKQFIIDNSLHKEIDFDVNVEFLNSKTEESNKICDSTKKGCYIATMAYGDFDHPQVLELRKFRDEFLDKFYLGKQFIKFYYKYSPKLVEKLENKQSINNAIRKSLDQFVKLIKKKK